MPKQKTHKGMKKRFKLTANGKVKFRSENRGHMLSGKTPKRRRHLRQDTVVSGVTSVRVMDGLRPSL